MKSTQLQDLFLKESSLIIPSGQIFVALNFTLEETAIAQTNDRKKIAQGVDKMKMVMDQTYTVLGIGVELESKFLRETLRLGTIVYARSVELNPFIQYDGGKHPNQSFQGWSYMTEEYLKTTGDYDIARYTYLIDPWQIVGVVMDRSNA